MIFVKILISRHEPVFDLPETVTKILGLKRYNYNVGISGKLKIQVEIF